jgi:hypothetical protein
MAGEDLAAGTTIGDGYEIVEPISAGAMGAVYRARRDGEEVAVKRLTDPRAAVRFEIEARLLAQLDHPRVVRVRDHFEDPAGSFLVMDLVAGESLAHVLDRRGAPGLPVPEAVEIVGQLCEALDYVHAEQVVHRDVKPENAILGQEGVVLVDFGIAREYTDFDEGTVGIGTPRFMAPEVLAGGIVSPRSDVFGAAATLWTLIAGRPPMYGDAVALGELAEGVDRSLETAVQAGLALDPHDRLRSAAELADAIGAPLSGRDGASLARSVSDASAPRDLLEAVVRAAAGAFDAAAASIALADRAGGGLVYEAAWGAGAREIVGVRLAPGQGVAGAVARSGRAEAVDDCRADERFAGAVAEATGYVPHTMMALPLRRGRRTIGVLAVLDRRDGRPYGPADLERAGPLADLATMAVDARATQRPTVAP